MPAARYWRAVGLQSVGGGALELSALHLYLGGARVDAAATLTSTFAPASGTLAALQDTDTATTARWLDVSAPGFALVWDFGSGNVQEVAAVRLGAGALYTEWLETLTLQHSSDGVAWTTLLLVWEHSWPGPGGTATMTSANALGGEGQQVMFLQHAMGTAVTTSYEVTTSTPAEAYAAWAADIGVSTTGTLQALDGDDAGFTTDLASPFFARGSTKALFSSEGAVGFYKSTPATTSGASYSISNISRMFGLDTRPLLLLSFHPQTDVKSFGVKLQRANGVTILYAQHSRYNNEAAYRYNVAIRIGVDGGLELVGQAFDQSVHLYLTEMEEATADSVLQQKLVLNQAAGSLARVTVRAFQNRFNLLAPAPALARIAASAPVPPHSTLSAPRLLTARNLEFAGTGTASATGTIYGSTAIKGAPNAPVRAKVSLLRARDLLLVQQTWSDPTTGAYAFHGLDPAEKYTTLAEYPTGDYRAVAADQLTPDIEEARAP